MTMNEELKESIQDVSDTVKQIFSTVRRFGPDEKDAVRDFVKSKVRSTLLRDNPCQSPDYETMDKSRPRKKDREMNEAPSRERVLDEDSEVKAEGEEPLQSQPKEPAKITRRLV